MLNMLKKITLAALVLCLALSFVGCTGGNAKLDDVSNEAMVRIEDYLDEAGAYFSLADSSLVISDTADKADVLEAYIDAATAGKALPEELIDTYVNSFKAGIDESVDEKELEAVAGSLIKEELVIHLAYSALKCPEITDEMRSEKAAEIAKELGCDTAAIFTPGNNTYTVDTAVKEALVKEKLEAAWDKANA